MKIKELDTQNFLLISEKINQEKEITQLKNQKNKEMESLKKIALEYEHGIKILVKKVIKMKKEKLTYEAERNQYKAELENLKSCFSEIKILI